MNYPSQRLQAVAALAREAGEAIQKVAESGAWKAKAKADKSPVTEADEAAHRIIDAGLRRIAPEIPIVSEENVAHPEFGEEFWCVDPLDGTRSFVSGDGEYTVNIALVEKGRAVLGVIYCPRDGVNYVGEVGVGAWRQREKAWEAISVAVQHKPLRAIIGSRDVRPRMKEFLRSIGAVQVAWMTSARKFCVVAEGGVDVYPRYTETYEWDTAAGQALVEAAGGRMTTMDGAAFEYGKKDFVNSGFVAWGAKK